MTQSRGAVADRFGQRGEEECIALILWPYAKTRVGLLQNSKQRVDVARSEQRFEGWIRREAGEQGRLEMKRPPHFKQGRGRACRIEVVVPIAQQCETFCGVFGGYRKIINQAADPHGRQRVHIGL